MSWLITSAVTNSLVAIPLACVAWLVARYAKRPAFAHLVWIAVLVKLLAPPIVAIPIPWQIDLPALLSNLNTTPAVTINPAAHSPQTKERQNAKRGSVIRKLPIVSATNSGNKAVSRSKIENAWFASPLGWIRAFGVAWILGAAFVGCRALYLAWRFHRQLEKSRSDEFLNIRMGRIAQSAGFKNWPEVVLLDGIFSPMLWGHGRRARLIFPAELAARLDRAASDTLLLHELAHYTRGDHWVRLVELAAKILFWWHPVVWLAHKGIEAAEEECCDAWVIEHQTSPRRTYAEALLATIDFLNEQSPALPPVASGLGEISLLRRRLIQIMRNEATSTLSPAARLAVVALVLLLAPLNPAVFASGSRAPRRMSVVPVASDRGAEAVATVERSEPPIAESLPTISKLARPASLTGRTATPWIPPALWATAVSPDGKFKLEASSVDVATRIVLTNLQNNLKVDLSSDGIRCVSFTAEGRFVTGHQDGNVRVWDSATGGVVLNLKGSDASINSVAFSSDGHLVAAGTSTGQALLWETTPGEEGTRYFQHELSLSGVPISSVRWSPRADRLAVSVAAWNDSVDAELVVWSLSKGAVVQRLPLAKPVGAIEWLSDDSVLVAEWDGMANIHELKSGRIISRLELEKNSLSAAAWSTECHLLARQRAQEFLQELP